MDDLAARISQLSPEQLAQLTQKLQQKRPQTAIIQAQPRDRTFPLSFAQQRLWFLHQMQPENSFYNVPAAIRVTGPLSVPILERSLTALCDRHEPLRTVFVLDSTKTPVQLIQPAQPWSLEVVDLQGLSPEAQQSEVKRLKVATATTPFDLTQSPLLRTCLLTLGPDAHILYLCFHHITTDGWALQIFVQELSILYRAFQQDLPSPLKPLKVQYADYAVWQRQHLQDSQSDRHLHYWQQQLEGVPTVLELPTDYPRPPVQSLKGARYPLKLGLSLTQALKQLSQAEGVTLFMTILTAFNGLLYRYTGQTDLLVGAPVANRNQIATEGLIGVLVNMLALRTQLQGDLSFRQLLQQVKATVVAANAHQDLPFERLVDVLQPQRSRSYAPLLQIILTVQTAPVETYTCGDLILQPAPLYTETTQFDLSLHLLETADGLQGSIEYNTDLFAAATIHRMANHLQMMLGKSVASPDCPIAQVLLLTPGERQQVLQQWNETQTPMPKTACIHQLFEQQVERTPNQEAVVFEQERLSYHELNVRANQLAHYLKAAGVGPETLVGVCLERSVDMVVSLLGILKAGGAYVPLDPSYPPERLRFVLENARVPILITQASLQQQLPPHTAQLICLEKASAAIATQAPVNPKATTTPLNLAYVIYTSGSTGQPKGVMNQHHGVCNRLLWMQLAYSLVPEDRVLQKTPFSFDVSVWEFFWPLFVGASLVVARPEGHKDPTYLTDVLAQERITTVHFVPSMLAVFLQHRPEIPLPHLKRVICSGEALPQPLQAAFFDQFEPAICGLHNLYGPTEAAIDVTAWQCQPESASGSVPIGRPIANTQIYLLDQHFQPVPVGIAGELHIGGIGVARGYLSRPALTAEKFIPNPFGEGRLYKTGDLARYRADGSIEFLGRIDHQVKLRGFRIELGEIEAILDHNAEVHQSVVLIREDIPQYPQLVAYVVGAADLDTAYLRSHLRDQLPEYMVPGAIVPLANLPLTPSGKVDRQSLPAPQPDLTRQSEYVQPSSDMEKTLASIWQSVLQVDQVGVDYNFFDLGGNSLLLIKAHAAMQEELGLTLPVVELFAHPTIRELSNYLTNFSTQQAEAVEREQLRYESRSRDRTAMKKRRQTRQRHRSP